MEQVFVHILLKLVEMQGKEVLLNTTRCKAFLADYTNGEYKKESRLILQAVEVGASKAIDAAQDIELCIKQQVMILQEDYSLAANVAVDVVNTLAFVLKGYNAGPVVGSVSRSAKQQNMTAGTSGDSSSYAKRGTAYFEKEQFDAAIKDFSEAIRLNPNVSDYFNYRGRAYANTEQYDLAIKDYSEAIRLDPNISIYYNKRGRAHSEKEQYDVAIKDFNEAIRLDPSDSDNYYYRGLSYENKQQYDEAIKNFDEAIKLNQSNSAYYNERGWAYYNKEQYDEAVENYNEAIRLDSSDSAYYYNRGLAYYYKEEYDTAIKDFSEAIRLDPSDSAYYCDRGKAYYYKEEYDTAIEDYSEAIRLNPGDSYYYYDRATVFVNKEQYDKAIKDYSEAIRLEPDNASAFADRGDCYYMQDKNDAAIKDYSKAIEIDPDFANAYKSRSLVYEAMGEKKQSKEDMAKFNSLDFKSNRFSYILFWFLGLCLSLFGFILWLALKKNHAGKARFCFKGSIISTIFVVLCSVLVFVSFLDLTSNTEKDITVQTEKNITTQEKTTQDTTRQTSSEPSPAKEFDEGDFIIPAIIVIIAIIIIWKWRSRPQCPYCNKRGGLYVVETRATGRAVGGYKIKSLRTTRRYADGSRGYTDRQIRVHVMRQPIITTYRCKHCDKECTSESTREWEDG